MKAKDLENLREKVLTRTTHGREDYILAEKGVFSIISVKYTKIISITKKISKMGVLYRCKSQHFRCEIHLMVHRTPYLDVYYTIHAPVGLTGAISNGKDRAK